MPGWLKALLIVLAALVVLVVAAIVIGAVYVAKNKSAWQAKGRELVAKGKEFGKTTDNQGCVDESMARYKKSPGYFNSIPIQMFMTGCLESSRPTPNFCESIPLGDYSKMNDWRDAQCQRYGLPNDMGCKQNLSMPIVMYCGEQKHKD